VMRKRMFGSLTLCLTAAGLAFADGVPPGKLSLTPPSQAVSDVPAKPVLPTEAGRSEKPSDQPEKPAKPQPEAPKEPEKPQPSQPGTASPTSSDKCTNQSQSGSGQDGTDKEKQKKEELRDDHCGPSEDIWITGEYLHWWTKNGSLTVPLVTSGGSVVLGNSDLAYGERPGGRWMVGFWLNERHVFGFEAGGFLMDWPSVSAAVNSDLFGSPGLERPVINALTGAPASVLVSLPATFAGGVAFTSESRMWGAEATFVRNLASDCHFHA